MLLVGKADTAYESAKNYFDRIHAPHKKFITFDLSGRFPRCSKSPGRFLVTLVQDVLPLAQLTAGQRLNPRCIQSECVGGIDGVRCNHGGTKTRRKHEGSSGSYGEKRLTRARGQAL